MAFRNHILESSSQVNPINLQNVLRWKVKMGAQQTLLHLLAVVHEINSSNHSHFFAEDDLHLSPVWAPHKMPALPRKLAVWKSSRSCYDIIYGLQDTKIDAVSSTRWNCYRGYYYHVWCRNFRRQIPGYRKKFCGEMDIPCSKDEHLFCSREMRALFYSIYLRKISLARAQYVTISPR